MAHDPREVAEELEELLPSILRRVYSGAEEEPFAELPVMQLRVVRSLAQSSKHMSALSAELGMSGSRLAHLVSRLEDSGFVVRTDNEVDRRVRVAALTEQGQRLVEKRRESRAGRLAEVLKFLSAEELDGLLRSLRTLDEKSRLASLHSAV
jgi:DNA-binding MarR family transcriptional regulator